MRKTKTTKAISALAILGLLTANLSIASA